MTVNELIKKDRFKIYNVGSNLEQTIAEPFCCDLLSIAMGKAPAKSAWVTVMGNINTLAVASLAEISCIILAEGVKLDPASLEKAKEQDITVLGTEDHIFSAALAVHQYLYD